METVWVAMRPQLERPVVSAWLRGKDERSVASQYAAEIEEYGLAIVLEDIKEQYSTLRSLESFFHQPQTLVHQDIIPMDRHRLDELITMYYGYDGVLMRQLIGRQLSRGLRKDLDEIDTADELELKSRRRQFDNLKRIFKALADQPGRMEDAIRAQFLLNASLARDYAAMVFISDNRLNTDKKSLTAVPLETFLQCAHYFMDRWTNVREPGGSDQDLDKNLLQDLRELRYGLVGKDVTDRLRIILLEALPAELEGHVDHIVAIFQSTVQIGAGLSHSREWRDIFEDLVERVVQPLHELRLSPEGFGQLLAHLEKRHAGIGLAEDLRAPFARSFRRFAEVVVLAVTALAAPQSSPRSRHSSST